MPGVRKEVEHEFFTINLNGQNENQVTWVVFLSFVG